MIGEGRIAGRQQLLVGATLGMYAAAIALAPGISTKALLAAPLVAIPLFWNLIVTPKAWLVLFFLCALLTPPLPIPLGDTGPHLALLFAASGVFVGILRLEEWRIRLDEVLSSMLALWALFAASVGFAALYSGVTIASGSLARVFLFGISIYVFLYARDGPARMHLQQAFRAVRLLFFAGTIAALFACVDFYFQFPAPAGYEPQFVWLQTGVFRRAQGFFYEASTLGNVCAFFLEMIAVALLRPKDEERQFSRFALLAGGIILFAALVLSYSRASLVNLVIAGTALLWLSRNRVRWARFAAGLAIFGTGAAAGLLLAFPVFANMAWLRVSAVFRYFSESPNAVLSGRLSNWATLIDFLVTHPWHALLGIGYKTLPYSDFIGTRAVGDNTYLTLLAETGVLGLCGVIALNAAILASAYRAARSPDSARSFCGTWMFCFWAGQVVQMFSADLLTYWRVLPLYFFVLAIATREPA